MPTFMNAGGALLGADPERWPLVSTPQGDIAVVGADHIEIVDSGALFHRLPEFAIRRIPMEFFRAVEAQPAGVRLSMKTRATAIELVVSTTAVTFLLDELTGVYGQFDLLVDGEKHSPHSTRPKISTRSSIRAMASIHEPWPSFLRFSQRVPSRHPHRPGRSASETARTGV